jgi:hypothetical protein
MKPGVVFAGLLLAAGAAAAAPLRPTPPANPDARPPPVTEPPAVDVSRRFPTLDAYLAWLQTQSHLDRAWYREVRPGFYELQPGNLLRPAGDEGRQRLFTREELEKKFGFAK